MGRQNTTGQNHAFAPNAAVGAHIATQFISPRGGQFAVVQHADFCGIMPEIAENAPTTHINIVLQPRVADVGEVRHEHGVAQHAVFDFHSIADNAVITNTDLTAQVSIGAYAAIFTDAHMPLYHRAGFNDGALAELQHTVYHSQGMHGAVTSGLQMQQGVHLCLQAHPRWGIICLGIHLIERQGYLFSGVRRHRALTDTQKPRWQHAAQQRGNRGGHVGSGGPWHPAHFR